MLHPNARLSGAHVSPPAMATVLWLLLGCYLIGLAKHGDGFDVLVDGWLGNATTILPALVILGVAVSPASLATSGGRAARRELLLVGAGVLCWALGGLYMVVMIGRGANLPFPSLGDVGFLCFPVLIFAAVLSRVRRVLAGLQASVWLDAVIGGLGAATALAVLLGPSLTGASGNWLATAVAFAYPLSDMLLVAVAAGVAALHGMRPGPTWSWLLAGLLIFACADVVYALRIAHDAFALGTPLDGLWSLGLTMIAVGVIRPPPPATAIEVSPTTPALRGGSGQMEEARTNRTGALAVPAVATATAVAVLVLGRWMPVAAVATVLATGTLLAAAVRTQLAFRQVLRLHDLGRQARTDSLTGLGNRRALHEQLQPQLTGSRPAPLAVLLLDLDRFKEINDTLGHHVGDELLCLIGPRLSPALRPGDLLVRLGGDEFAVVLAPADAPTAMQVAGRLLDQLAEPFCLDGVPMRVSASLGVALCPQDATDINGLLQRADVAMYTAKADGGGVAHYNPARDQHSRERLRTLEELRTALDCEQLVVHYQPQCDVTTGDTIGLEALVRWQHPVRGLLFPDAFLPLVEQTGLMAPLTLHVLQVAVRQCRQWRLDGLDVGVSVNLSASSLVDERLPAQVAWLLTSEDLPASALTLELTEDTLMLNPEQCRATLLRLHELGVWLSIDDYGTGYSSLSYLQHLPVDELKLDRAFLADLETTRNAAIVKSTVELAHALDLRLVAEGVEDQASLDLLRQLGCDTAQGYYLSPPQSAAAITTWLREHRTGRITADLAVLPSQVGQAGDCACTTWAGRPVPTQRHAAAHVDENWDVTPEVARLAGESNCSRS